MSFFLDWWMLIGCGIIIALFSKIFYKEDSFLKYTLSILVLVVFYTFSIALFCELNAEEHGFLGQLNEFFFGFVQNMFPEYYANHPEATSCEFMYSSGEEWIKNWQNGTGLGGWAGSILKTEVPFDNLEELVKYHKLYLFFGIVMFCTYPFYLYVGTQLGFLMFGRKPGDKGALGLL
ncbi:MAG: hypothetical protein ACTSQJ_10470 [Promethearchaeota archaeon]